MGGGAFLYHPTRGPELDPLAIVLAEAPGDGTRGAEITRLQRELARPGAAPQLLERLGWAFVDRARSENDPGFYEIAEQAARALEARVPNDAGARLLRGHTLASRHRFAEAAQIARDLVAQRGAPADHGLLGDALLGAGQVTEAADAYQAMMDLRPDAHAFARAAEIRWLTGDVAGAVESMRVAARATSPRNAEAFGWTWSQLGLHQLRAGSIAEARESVDVALSVDPESANGWLVRGRLLLAEGRAAEAADALEHAADRTPLPESLWARADALRDAGREADAQRVELQIVERGESADPRGLALFLLCRDRDLPRALRLLERERASREDVFTLGALAVARARSGDARSAWPLVERALAFSTPDARLQLQAGIVAAAAGRRADADRWLRAADAHRALLLPSERRELDRARSS